MTEPGASSGWVRSDRSPSLGRWVIGCGIILLLLAVAIALITIVVLRSPIPRMVTASSAIKQQSDEQISAANFYWDFGSEPTFQIILEGGVPSSVARDLGCDVIERELAAQGLSGTHWTIYALDFHPILDSEEAHCS